MIEQIQQLLNRIRPTVHGKNPHLSSRFRTSDVLQESAVQLLREAKTREEDRPIPQAWLNRIGQGTVSKLRDKHLAGKRSKANETALQGDDMVAPNQSPHEAAVTQELISQLVLCLAKLSDQQREIIDSYLANQESFNSIAKRLEKPPHWVRRTYRQSIVELKSMMIRKD